MTPRTAAISAYVAAALRPAAGRLLAAAFLVDFAFVFVFIVAMQDFLTGQHYRGLYLPALSLSAYGAGKLIVQVAAGRLVDRLGWTKAARLSLAGILAAQLLLLAATASRPLLLPLSVTYGAFSALFWPALYAGISGEVAPADRDRLTSALTLVSGAGMALAFGAGFVLPGAFAFSRATLIATVPVALAALLFAAARAPAGSRPRPEPGGAVSWRAAIDRRVRAGATIMFLQSAAIAALVSAFRAYGRDALGVSFRTEVIGLAPVAAAFGLGALISGIAARAEGPPLRLRLALAFLLTALPLFWAATVSDGLLALALVTISAFFLGVAVPATTALVLEVASGARMGSALGIILTLEGLGHVCGPLAVGVLGGPGLALAAAAVFLLVASGTAAGAPITRAAGRVDRDGHSSMAAAAAEAGT